MVLWWRQFKRLKATRPAKKKKKQKEKHFNTHHAPPARDHLGHQVGWGGRHDAETVGRRFQELDVDTSELLRRSGAGKQRAKQLLERQKELVERQEVLGHGGTRWDPLGRGVLGGMRWDDVG